MIFVCFQIERAEPLSAVSGSFHQASPSFATHEAAGAQCCTICLMAIIAGTRVLPASLWEHKHIDMVLYEGNKVHENVLVEKGWPYKRKEARFATDELPSILSVSLFHQDLNVSVGLKDDSLYGFRDDIQSLLTKALSLSSGVLARVDDSCISILKDAGKIYIFDPHARDSQGNVSANGSAALFKFCDIQHASNFLRNSIQCYNVQLDLHPVHVAVLRDELLSDNGSNSEDPASDKSGGTWICNPYGYV